MKRTLTLLFLFVFSFSLSLSALADGIYEPEDDFYLKHRDECRAESRRVYTNGESGYVTFFRAPGGEALRNELNGKSYVTEGVWKDSWYLVNRVADDRRTAELCWARASDLAVQYDSRSFLEEHEGELEAPDRAPELDLGELDTLTVWPFPGAETAAANLDAETLNSLEGEYGSLRFGALWRDPLGQTWGRISNIKWYSWTWVCLDAPESADAPWVNEAATARALTEKLIPAAEKAPRVNVGGLWPPLGLAAGAVVLALALLTIFRKRKKGDVG